MCAYVSWIWRVASLTIAPRASEARILTSYEECTCGLDCAIVQYRINGAEATNIGTLVEDDGVSLVLSCRCCWYYGVVIRKLRTPQLLLDLFKGQGHGYDARTGRPCVKECHTFLALKNVNSHNTAY